MYIHDEYHISRLPFITGSIEHYHDDYDAIGNGANNRNIFVTRIIGIGRLSCELLRRLHFSQSSDFDRDWKYDFALIEPNPNASGNWLEDESFSGSLTEILRDALGFVFVIDSDRSFANKVISDMVTCKSENLYFSVAVTIGNNQSLYCTELVRSTYNINSSAENEILTDLDRFLYTLTRPYMTQSLPCVDICDIRSVITDGTQLHHRWICHHNAKTAIDSVMHEFSDNLLAEHIRLIIYITCSFTTSISVLEMAGNIVRAHFDKIESCLIATNFEASHDDSVSVGAILSVTCV